MPQPQKPKAKPTTVQVGRQTRALPVSTATPEGLARARLTSALERNDALRKEHAEQLEAVKAQAAATRLEGYRANVRANATSFFAPDVSGAELARATNNVVNAFDRHVRAGLTPTAFDVARECKEVRFRRGHGNVAPVPQATALADQRLPTRPGADPEREEWVRAQEADRQREQTARERDAANLKRWGLQDPRIYAPCG